MTSKKSQLQRDLDAEDRIKARLSIDVGAPVFPDTRLSALVGQAGAAVKRFMPIIPMVAKVQPVAAVASDHHATTIGETIEAQEAQIEYRQSSPNRRLPDSKMRHHRVRA